MTSYGIMAIIRSGNELSPVNKTPNPDIRINQIQLHT